MRLVEVGTHSRGSIFLNGRNLQTPELLSTIDDLSRKLRPLPGNPEQLAGLYLGRYDLKVPDESYLRSGQRWKVLELNGVTSEPTHIYDPEESLWSAWCTLAKQWRLAFEIGAENRSKGAKVSTLRELWRLGRPPA